MLNSLTIGAMAVAALLVVGWRYDHEAQARKIEAVRNELIVTRTELTQARSNVITLERALADQNAAIAREKAKGDAIERQAQQDAAEARREALQARRTLDAFMARKPVGDTEWERVQDVAAQIREAVR